MYAKTSAMQFSIRRVFAITTACVFFVALPCLVYRSYYWERSSVTDFLKGYSDICNAELNAWNDDFSQKIMAAKITSKSNSEHCVKIGRIYGAPISEPHFHLLNIDGRNLFCYRQDNQGKRVIVREGVDIGQDGVFSEILKIKSLRCVILRHDEIAEIIKNWPGPNDKHGAVAVAGGQLRYYASPES
ncbi:MAG: hypothetical protein AAGA30_06020 [Planctomycetota bacterium]